MRPLLALVAVVSLAHADEELPSRENWLALMGEAMPRRACREGGSGRGCYQASEAGCLAVEQALMPGCLDKVRDKLPEFVAMREGASNGATIGLCSADSYELIFGDTRDLKRCPLDAGTAKQVMKRADWVAALEAGLPARVCVENPDADSCRAMVGRCIAAVTRKAPAKLRGAQRADWLGRVVACTAKP